MDIAPRDVVAPVAVSRDGRALGLLRWLHRRVTVAGTFVIVGIVVAACAWLAFVTVPGLGTALAAFLGIGNLGTALVDVAVLVLAVVGFVGGGSLVDRAFGEAAIGIGALVAGVGALAFVVLPGALTTVVVALCSLAAIGVVLPAVVVRANVAGGRGRLGTVLALVGVGALLVNAVVLVRWYLLADWLGLVATSHLLADGVVGIPPRSLVYETFGSWRRALLVVGASLVAVAGGWFAIVGTPTVERVPGALGGRRQSTLAASPPPVAWGRFRQPKARATWLVVAGVAWTVAGGLSVYGGVVESLDAPIMALAGRLLVVAIVPGVLLGGVALDRFGTRPVLATGLAGGVAGPTGYSLAAGPSTEGVAALPPGAPWLLVSLLVTGLAVGVLLVCLFALPLLVPDVGADDVGTAAGLVLATALVTALIARALNGVDGRASLLDIALLAGPAVGGIVALRWLERRRAGTTTEATVEPDSGETE